METIGLIAGSLDLPVLFARQARKAGFRLASICFREEPNRSIPKASDFYEMISLGQFGRLLKFFKEHGVRRAAMMGRIRHTRVFQNIKPDLQGALLWLKMKDRKTESILGTVADELGKKGVRLQKASWLMEPYLVQKAVYSRKKPDTKIWKDFTFARHLVKGIGQLDIGQSVVVKDQCCVSVESIEGTDAAILRAGKLAGAGAVLVKKARPRQDLRFDLPVVGPKTFLNLVKIKAAGVSLEAGKTIFLKKEQCLKIADRAGMVVVGE